MTTQHQRDMQDVMNKHPSLTNEGVAAGKGDRDWLLSEEAIAQFAAARNWFRNQTKTIGFNERCSSYGLKHTVEDVIGYTANGAFIAAAVAEGFKTKNVDTSRNNPNVRFNISRRLRMETV